ncbi:rhodanese-like domain-containing protein [Natrinema altunense]|uniref:Rhodanese-like domain-containing protein n=1 Tax=Natrinema altunense TaxID=222984 RepID=A0A482Y2C9_9EURY|nr:rhodanese-like domain-containing protein [Natrinema altunense]RZH69622.1 rhodanese-like domain-containing protein [Natrinema altunense]
MDGEISTDEVKELLEADADVRIVDIRDERNFEHSHIPGSENIPFHELTDRVDELEGEDHIVTVCPHGKASVQAAQLIGSYEGTADARVESMAGGLDKYGMKFGLVREADSEDESADRESPF